MIVHDEALKDQIAVLALGVLPSSDAQIIRLHLLSCECCRTEYNELRSACDTVGIAAEIPADRMDARQSSRMKARIMATLRTRLDAKVPSSTATPPPRSAWFAYTLAAAAMLLALLSALRGITLDTELHTAQEHVSQLHERINEQARAAAEENARIADLFAADGKHYPVDGGEIVKRGDHIYLAMSSLPKLPPGHVFQAWVVRKETSSVSPSITFTPNRGTAIVELPVNASNIVAVAVSVEPEGGSKKPTTRANFIQRLT